MDQVAPYDQLGVTPVPDFQNANPSAGQKGSIINATVFNALQSELLNIQDAAGMTRSASDFTQVLRAIRGGKLEYYVDAGSVNAPAIAPSPAHLSLFDGLHVRVKMAAANTGPAPLSVNALSAPIKRRAAAALVGGEWAAGDIIDFVYSAALGAFQIAGLTPSDVSSQIAAKAPNGTIVTNGWWRDPNTGFTIEWGSLFVNNSSGFSNVTFPRAFTTLFSCIASDNAAQSWSTSNASFNGIGTPSTTGFQAQCATWTGSAVTRNVAVVFGWHAFGIS